MKPEKKKIQRTINELRARAICFAGDIEDIVFVECGYKKDDIPPETGWCRFEKGQRIQGSDKHFWFRLRFKTPSAAPNRYVVLSTASGYEGQRDTINPQGMVFINGKIKQALDTNHTEVILEADTDYEIFIYFYVASVTESFEYKLWLSYIDEPVRQLYYDMMVPFSACMSVYYENSYEYAVTLKALDAACNILKLNYPYSDEFYASVSQAREYMQSEYYDKLCGDSPVTVNCIGHTHIDVAWLWTLAQTREKIQRSFATVLDLMKRYPEYRFMMSQPQLFRYLSEVDPQMYAEVKRLVKEGRCELEGGMWLEADCNLISGESMVRQLLHGKRFLKKEFDTDSRVLWLPDVFGYSAALPQILKKSGIEHFVTSKISWNDTNTMPYDTFMWKGIDGSEIITDFITAQDYRRGGEFTNETTYVGLINPSMVAGTWNRYQQKQYNDKVMLIYGWGDGGGGPTADMLEQQRRLSHGLPGIPKTHMSSLKEHLEYTTDKFMRSCEEIGKTPEWDGELYLEFHRGTYTSMAENKRNNRKSEMLMQRLEAVASCCSALLGAPYKKDEFYSIWDTMLLNQFHDVIPGSSIKEVYEDSRKQYAEITERAEAELSSGVKLLAENTTAKSGILVYNSLGFERSDIIMINGEAAESGLIPAYGWKVIEKPVPQGKVKTNGTSAENDFFILNIDDAGRICRLYDKRCGREVIKSGCFANELQIFEDMPLEYENWELAEYYGDKCRILNDKAEIAPVYNGCRAGFRITRKYHGSVITQEIYLYDNLERIDVVNTADWHERKQLLKIAFPFDIHTGKAVYDIQFGNVERGISRNTSWEKAKFEVCGHKWVDMSEYGYGVSLLNDCKYGFSIDDGVLKLTAIKCGTYPNVEADQGMHEFTYSIYPHSGDFRDGGTVQAAYSLNQPLVTAETNGTGELPTEFSIVSCDKNNIIVDTLKQCEDSEAYIIRLYDAYNCRSTAKLSFGLQLDSAEICDLMENTVSKLAINGNSVTVPVGNYEIQTIKVTFKNR